MIRSLHFVFWMPASNVSLSRDFPPPPPPPAAAAAAEKLLFHDLSRWRRRSANVSAATFTLFIWTCPPTDSVFVSGIHKLLWLQIPPAPRQQQNSPVQLGRRRQNCRVESRVQFAASTSLARCFGIVGQLLRGGGLGAGVSRGLLLRALPPDAHDDAAARALHTLFPHCG